MEAGLMDASSAVPSSVSSSTTAPVRNEHIATRHVARANSLSKPSAAGNIHPTGPTPSSSSVDESVLEYLDEESPADSVARIHERASSLFPSFRQQHLAALAATSTSSSAASQSARADRWQHADEEFDELDYDGLAPALPFLSASGHPAGSASASRSRRSSIDSEATAAMFDDLGDDLHSPTSLAALSSSLSDTSSSASPSPLHRQQHLSAVLNNPNPSALPSGTSPALALAMPLVSGLQRSLLDWLGPSSAAASSASLARVPLPPPTLAPPPPSLGASALSAVSSVASTVGSTFWSYLGASQPQPVASSSSASSSSGSASGSTRPVDAPPPLPWLTAGVEADAEARLSAYLTDMKQAALQFGARHAHSRLAPPSTTSSASGEPSSSAASGPSQAEHQFEEALASRQLAACLAAVPAPFFRADLRLADLDLFRSLADPAAAVLPEKLAHYLDVVEVNLLKQISCRSQSFFAALATIQDLYVEVGAVCESIHGIRCGVTQLRRALVESASDVMRGSQRQTNLAKLQAKLDLLNAVRKSLPALQNLLANREFVLAVQLVHTVQKVLSGELAGLRCVRGLDAHVHEVRQSMGQLMLQAFVDLALPDTSATPTPTPPSSSSSTVTPVVGLAADEEEAARGVELLSLATCLTQLGMLPLLLPLLRDRLLSSIKDAVRLTLAAALDPIEAETQQQQQPLLQQQQQKQQAARATGAPSEPSPLSTTAATSVTVTASAKPMASSRPRSGSMEQPCPQQNQQPVDKDKENGKEEKVSDRLASMAAPIFSALVSALAPPPSQPVHLAANPASQPGQQPSSTPSPSAAPSAAPSPDTPLPSSTTAPSTSSLSAPDTAASDASSSSTSSSSSSSAGLSLAQRLERLAPAQFARVLGDVLDSLRPWLRRLAHVRALLFSDNAPLYSRLLQSLNNSLAIASSSASSPLSSSTSSSSSSPSSSSSLSTPMSLLPGGHAHGLPLPLQLQPSMQALLDSALTPNRKSVAAADSSSAATAADVPSESAESAESAEWSSKSNLKAGARFAGGGRRAGAAAANPLLFLLINGAGTASPSISSSSSSSSQLQQQQQQAQSEKGYRQLRSEFGELFTAVAEFAHTRCARILETRKQAHLLLTVCEFQQLWDLCLDFIFFSEDLLALSLPTSGARLATPALPSSAAYASRPFLPQHAASKDAAKDAKDGTKDANGAPTSASSSSPSVSLVSLRQALAGQARELLAATHVRQKEALHQLLLAETWVSAPPTPAAQLLLDRAFVPALAAGASGAAAAHAAHAADGVVMGPDGRPVWEARRWDEDDEADVAAGGAGGAAGAAAAGVGSRSAKKTLLAGGERFFVVGSVLVLLEQLGALVAMPFSLRGAVGAEALQRCVDALNHFNSRACQLVLGAGAMQSAARLKTITAKHLALAAQCLGLLLATLPLLRQALGAHLPGRQSALLTALDGVARDLEEHRREIFAKLVGILTDLADKAAARLLQQISLAARTPLDALHESVFDVDVGVARLLDSTRLLHKALSGLLATHERDLVFRQIASKLGLLFAQCLSKADQLQAPGASASQQAAADVGAGMAGPSSNASLIRRKMITVNCRFIVSEVRKLEGLDATACKELEKFI